MKTSKPNFAILGQNALKQTAVFFLLFLFSLLLHAQQIGEIKGKVFDKQTKESIPGANVYVEVGGKKIGSATDMDGRFTIKPLQPGTYNLNISYMGYNTLQIYSVSVNTDKITLIKDVFLESASTKLGPHIVTGRKYEESVVDFEEASKMAIKGADLNKMPDNRNLANVLQSITTDIKVSDDGSIQIRGGRSGTEAYYVDGVLSHSINNLIPSMAIRSMAVYTGGIPAQYGDITSGVVVIETLGYFDLYNEWLAKNLYEEHLKEKEAREQKEAEQESIIDSEVIE
ncbi:MAG: TonB-dependent receptor [Bacteroidota bacterium]|nr:TonB-dependent receptor [Bacteroidota bacterium]